MTPHILIIDEDLEFTALLKTYFAGEGIELSSAHDGSSGLKKALNQSFDAIILDVCLKKINGFMVLQHIRQHLTIPTLFLTSRSDDIDKIIGLELGADDYLLKPCNPRELLARIRALLRRIPKIPPVRQIIENTSLKLDSAQRALQKDGQAITLTETEFKILEMLMQMPRQAYSKEELTEYVLGRKFTPHDRSIDVHVSRLRQKLGFESLKTVRGFGYIFNDATCSRQRP